MSLEIHRDSSSAEERQPRLELASNLLAVLNDVETRDFNLDIQQDEALVAVGRALIDGTPSGYVEMATSTGKTAVEALVAEAAVRNGHRVLMLAPKVEIAQQIAGSDETRPTGLLKFAALSETVKIMPHYAGEKADKDASIVVSTYAGFLNDAKNNHNQLGEFDVIIADECHRSLGAETSKILKTAFPGAFKLGLSATPDFASDRKSDEVYDQKLYEFSLMEAVESGKTAALRALVYETDETVVAEQSFGDYTERDLAPLIENLQRNGTALEMAESLVAEGRQGLIACIPGSNNVHARRMAQLLQQRGIASLDVGSHLTSDEQHARLKQFQAGGVDVLTFTRTLEEGWDSDRASFAINMAPTTSPVRTKQLIGRVLRKKPDGSESIYIDFVDQTHGATKGQYTALHALDLEYVDLNRTLGSYSDTGETGNDHPSPLQELNPRLIELLAKSQGKRIADITVPPKINAEILKWEKILQEDFKKDGESATLSEHIILDDVLAKRYQKAYDKFVTQNGLEPTVDELTDELGKLTKEQQDILASYAFRLPLDDAMIEAVENQPDTAMDAYLEHARDEMANRALVLADLDKPEYGVMMVAHGLIDCSPYVASYHTAGFIFGTNALGARRIEQQAAQKIRDYLGDVHISPAEHSLGEYLNLYANFDVYNPTTVEQGRTAYALLALENFAEDKARGRLKGRHAVRKIRDAFDIDQIVLPETSDERLTIDIPELILPVVEVLHRQARDSDNNELIKILDEAMSSLDWLYTQSTKDRSVTLDIVPSGVADNTSQVSNIRFGSHKNQKN